MFSRLWSWLARLRTWLRVRLALLRGAWRRGQVRVAATPLAPLFANHVWSYALYCPPGLRDDEAAPLVLLLHGCRQRALGFAQASGWVHAAQAQRFRLLCPQQRTRANLWRCWNWFTPAAQRGAGELDAMRALLDAAAARVAIADRGIAVVGLSAGGGLAALMAFHAAERIAAAVTVAAPPLLGRVSSQDPRDVMARGLLVAPVLALSGSAPVAPLLLVHGRADTVVAPVCGEQLAQQVHRAAERSGAAWIDRPALAIDGGTQTDALRRGDAQHAQHVQHARDAQDADSAALALRVVWLDALAHAWTGAPGGHPYVLSEGPALTPLVLRFLREVGVLR
ncbi:MAG: PHB depolymerase family esterase [Burkholderiaceae bacterium]|jgi:feruloyl esterase|nr:PHB depolymerase family esterase [Burkholderiaceae bacterium]